MTEPTSDELPQQDEVLVSNPNPSESSLDVQFRKLIEEGVFPREGLSPEYIDADRQFSASTIRQLKKHGLEPDGQTMYICDTGIGHGVKIAADLRELGVSSSVAVDEQSINVVSHLRYRRSVELYGNPGSVDSSKGEMIILDGHATPYIDKFDKVRAQLPTEESLKQKGVRKVVLLAEAGFGEELQAGDSFYLQNSHPVNEYLREISKTGAVEVFAIGVDSRIG